MIAYPAARRQRKSSPGRIRARFHSPRGCTKRNGERRYAYAPSRATCTLARLFRSASIPRSQGTSWFQLGTVGDTKADSSGADRPWSHGRRRDHNRDVCISLDTLLAARNGMPRRSGGITTSPILCAIARWRNPAVSVVRRIRSAARLLAILAVPMPDGTGTAQIPSSSSHRTSSWASTATTTRPRHPAHVRLRADAVLTAGATAAGR